MTSDVLDKNSELKQMTLYDTTMQHFDEVDMSESIDPPQTFHNFLFKKYSVNYSKKQLTKHYNKIARLKERERARNEAENRRQVQADMVRLRLLATF